jgi:hypothetical protein
LVNVAKSSPLNDVKKLTSDECNVEHVVTDNLGRTEREKKNPVRRRRQFKAKKIKIKIKIN